MKGKLKENSSSRCAKCVGGRNTDGGANEQEVVLEDGRSLERVNMFCYLGDMLGAAGGCGVASGSSWGLGPVRGVCIVVDRKSHTLEAEGYGILDMYTACSSETWVKRVE